MAQHERATVWELAASLSLLAGSVACGAVVSNVQPLPLAFIKRKEGPLVDETGEFFDPPEPILLRHMNLRGNCPKNAVTPHTQSKRRS